MGTLKFRFVKGKSILYYETNGTDKGTVLCLDSWFGPGQMIFKGEDAEEYFKILIKKDRVLTEGKRK